MLVIATVSIFAVQCKKEESKPLLKAPSVHIIEGKNASPASPGEPDHGGPIIIGPRPVNSVTYELEEGIEVKIFTPLGILSGITSTTDTLYFSVEDTGHFPIELWDSSNLILNKIIHVVDSIHIERDTLF